MILQVHADGGTLGAHARLEPPQLHGAHQRQPPTQDDQGGRVLVEEEVEVVRQQAAHEGGIFLETGEGELQAQQRGEHAQRPVVRARVLIGGVVDAAEVAEVRRQTVAARSMVVVDVKGAVVVVRLHEHVEPHALVEEAVGEPQQMPQPALQNEPVQRFLVAARLEEPRVGGFVLLRGEEQHAGQHARGEEGIHVVQADARLDLPRILADGLLPVVGLRDLVGGVVGDDAAEMRRRDSHDAVHQVRSLRNDPCQHRAPRSATSGLFIDIPQTPTA